MEAIRPVFETLTDDSLLQKCLHGGTQNSNESFHHLIWEGCPKTTFCGRERLGPQLWWGQEIRHFQAAEDTDIMPCNASRTWMVAECWGAVQRGWWQRNSSGGNEHLTMLSLAWIQRTFTCLELMSSRSKVGLMYVLLTGSLCFLCACVVLTILT